MTNSIGVALFYFLVIVVSEKKKKQRNKCCIFNLELIDEREISIWKTDGRVH